MVSSLAASASLYKCIFPCGEGFSLISASEHPSVYCHRFVDDGGKSTSPFEALAGMEDVGQRIDETGVDDEHRTAARAFGWIVKSVPGRTESKLAAKRLAELRAKSLPRLQADEPRRLADEVDAKSREAEVSVLEVATALHQLADALYLVDPNATPTRGQGGAPTQTPIDILLKPRGHDFDAQNFWGGDSEVVINDFGYSTGWLDATNKLIYHGSKGVDGKTTYADAPPNAVALKERLLASVKGIRGSGVNERMLPVALVDCALRLVGLALGTTTQRIKRANGKRGDVYLSASVVELSVEGDPDEKEPTFLGLSLADAHAVKCYEFDGIGKVRSDQYKSSVRAARTESQRRRGEWSGAGGQPDLVLTPVPMGTRGKETVFDPEARRYEEYDATALLSVVNDYRTDMSGRNECIKELDAAIRAEDGAHPDSGRSHQLQSWRRALWGAKDEHAAFEALLELPLGENGMRGQWVVYIKDGMGRRYAHAEATAQRCGAQMVTRLDTADGLDTHLTAHPRAIVDTPGHVKLSVCFQTMFRTMRPVLAGASLCDGDMVKACTAIAVDNAARLRFPAERVSQIEDYRSNGAQWLDDIATFHALATVLGSADAAKDASKALMSAMLFGDNAEGSYAHWKKEHSVVANAGLPLTGSPLEKLGEFNRQALGLRKYVFKHLNLKRKFEIERDKLRREREDWIRTDGGDPAREINRSLFASWLFEGEDAVLMIVGHELVRLGWEVVALIFDGLMVKHRPDVRLDVGTDAALRKVEAVLSEEGWPSVKLVEKPLYGCQNGPLERLEAARAAALRAPASPPSSGRAAPARHAS